jgi:hypothetical protein
MSPLVVVGTGLVTPLARTPAQHALFVRAEVTPPAPGAFVDAEGEPIPVAYCPWLDTRLSVADRLRALAARAFADARAPIAAAGSKIPLAMLVVTGAPRAGLTESDRTAVEAELTPASAHLVAQRLTGEAGFFQGLAQAEGLLASGDVRAVALVAADSFVSAAALAERARAVASPWRDGGGDVRPAEGAAAVIVTTAGIAREEGLAVLATIRSAGARMGEGRDDDDAVVDGAAMTALLRDASDAGRLGASFGQHGVDALRDREWAVATTRYVEALDASCVQIGIETAIGRLGAASGAASFVHGLAVATHGAWPAADGPRTCAAFAAWAISPDGLRGLCVATARDASVIGTSERIHSAATAPSPVSLKDVRASAGDDALRAPNTEVPANAAPMHVDSDRAEPVSTEVYERAVVADCMDRIAMLARQRDERPLRERGAIEARLLAQLAAIVASGASILEIREHGDQASGDDAWATWAAVFALASAEGQHGLEAVAAHVQALPEDAGKHAQLAAEALLGAPNPGRMKLGERLLAEESPVAKAVGVELLSRVGMLDDASVMLALREHHPVVKAAALRALARRPSLDAALLGVRACLHHEDAAVAWEAARALTMHGRRDAHDEVSSGSPVVDRLGPRAVDILAFAGSLDDLPVVQRLVRRLPMSAEVLSAVARFGHPAVWPYLLHGLERPIVADDAHRALVLLFGPLVDEDAGADPASWRRALELAPIPEGVRWRYGQPWSATSVEALCASGELARHEVESMRDEVRSQGAGARSWSDLAAWSALQMEACGHP